MLTTTKDKFCINSWNDQLDKKVEFFNDIIWSLQVEIWPIPSNYDQVCFLVTIGGSWSKTKTTKNNKNENNVEKYLIFSFVFFWKTRNFQTRKPKFRILGHFRAIFNFFNCLEIPEFLDMSRNVFMMCFLCAGPRDEGSSSDENSGSSDDKRSLQRLRIKNHSKLRVFIALGLL